MFLNEITQPTDQMIKNLSKIVFSVNRPQNCNINKDIIILNLVYEEWSL
jgi:hypothetical protein